ncbi:NYN domain-containing protein [Homoserinibacter sp. YIM 151385]|uniref:NYN domain-containing protein n=1 Tax=Homoserinibacter sp. YIM 151385 TaxID=2985506 RepID=UPI0022EFF3CB|nr:NYN domain-containing protein [Homoserinibacter sp. YIM 151385]WBU39110.1 NYN domain-containing protein [Homoserinibacter sp. YIM 151385]
MASPVTPRVAVYIDFDNIVISHYDFVHGRDAWRKDQIHGGVTAATRPKLAQAQVDVGAILDYASSFGTVAISRAYADWSIGANADYRRQLIDRAVDLTQLFPVSKSKNGADIRLSVDVVEDLFRLPDITHVVIVAGDSDYIALTQRAKRLGRFVVGIGIEGSTSVALKAACDQFAVYDDLLDEEDAAEIAATQAAAGTPPAGSRGRGGAAARRVSSAPASAEEPADAAAVDDAAGTEAGAPAEHPAGERITPKAATRLLVRAMRLIGDKQTDDEWMTLGEVKNQMLRLNPAFAEKPLGHGSFQDFVAERNSLVELDRDPSGRQPRIRLRARQ